MIKKLGIVISCMVLLFSCSQKEKEQEETGKEYVYDTRQKSPTGNHTEEEWKNPNSQLSKHSTFRSLQVGGNTTGLVIKSNDTDAKTDFWHEETRKVYNDISFNVTTQVSPGYYQIESRNKRTGELRTTRALVRGGEIMEVTIYFN